MGERRERGDQVERVVKGEGDRRVCAIRHRTRIGGQRRIERRSG
jgi:hypothetical protein